MSSSDVMSSLHVLTFSEPLRQSSRCDFDAEGVPDHYDPGTDDLPLVIREHFQLPLNQRFQILDDIGKIRRRSPRIETQISLPVLLKLLLPNLWRSAGQIPGGTGGRSDDSASPQSYRPLQESLLPFPRSSRKPCASQKCRSSLVESFLASNGLISRHLLPLELHRFLQRLPSVRGTLPLSCWRA